MTPAPQPIENVDSAISFAELIDDSQAFIGLVWRERRYLYRCLAATIPFGLFVAFGSSSEYTASTRLLPYRSPSTPTSSLSGLAGLAGIRLPSGVADPTITADLYPEVAKTLDFRMSVAETPIRFSAIASPTSVVTYFGEISTPSAVDVAQRYTVGLPKRFIAALQPAIEPLALAGSEAGKEQLTSYDETHLAAAREIESRLKVDINRKTSIITIQATMPDRYAAADLVRAASERLMARIIDYESRKAGEQRLFIETEQLRARTRFAKAQEELAGFTDRNRGTLSATAQIEAQRLQGQYNMAFDLYRQFSTELEQARIKQNQDTPVFTVLEKVVVPRTRSSPNRTFDILGSIIVGLSIGTALIWWRENRRHGT